MHASAPEHFVYIEKVIPETETQIDFDDRIILTHLARSPSLSIIATAVNTTTIVSIDHRNVKDAHWHTL